MQTPLFVVTSFLGNRWNLLISLSMKKILVHLHIWYPDLWPQMQRCLESITVAYDLIVTHTHDLKEVEGDIKKYKYDACFVRVPNRGFDIGAFVHVLNLVDLSHYEYIVKLHTKRTMNKFVYRGLNLSGDSWRNRLVSFVSSPEQFNRCLSIFQKRSDVGMIAHHELITPIEEDEDTYSKERQMSIISDRGWEYIPYYFVAGTMFIARSECFILLGKEFTIQDFPISERGVQQLAHVLERLIGYFVYRAHYVIYPIGGRLYSDRRKIFRRIFSWLKRALRQFL